jgi:hypothetical protein
MNEHLTACSHGSEFQIKCVREDGPEEVTGWMNSEEQLAGVIAGLTSAKGRAYWLRKRIAHCAECMDEHEQIIAECPISNLPSARYRPHDSGYLQAVGSRNRSELMLVNLRYSQ